MAAITGLEWTEESFEKAGERIINIERHFNHREGFSRRDDWIPDRFFEDAPTSGPSEGMLVGREAFNKMLDEYYAQRGWDPQTAAPGKEKLDELELGFTQAE